MSEVNQHNPIPLEHVTEIRVRYQETDAQGRVHHSNYANYFEIGRVEMLRASGRTYRDLEAHGIMLVVVSLSCKFYKGAQYDDLLKLVTRVVKAKGVRITHQYQLYLGTEIVAEGETVVAAVNPKGKLIPLPEDLRFN